MYEYKVLVVPVKKAEEEMNKFAKDGWKVIEVSPNSAMGQGLVVTLEREEDNY